MLFNFTSPQDLHWILSGDFVMMIVLGGMRNFWGPLLGTTIFVVAQDYLSSITGNWMTFVGLIFVGIVLLFPKGLLGMVGRGTELQCQAGHARRALPFLSAASGQRRPPQSRRRAKLWSCCVSNMSAATSARFAPR